MNSLTEKALEKRRNELIDRLIAFHVYKKEGRHLFELTLPELEDEYKSIQTQVHPHSGWESLRWCRRK
ncbi:Fur-regulated basic protein FbpA [Heyndrickxia acidiproducens]|uniref:Fur-regulated basic protein FbpA n=1 Tax=Heyndrickxia acidiproducens TaxID=1121084 RepID=UPI000382D7FE|nr:Fur-regulated basic protein FbpA [Heyndrickxia acidiproducens]